MPADYRNPSNPYEGLGDPNTPGTVAYQSRIQQENQQQQAFDEMNREQRLAVAQQREAGGGAPVDAAKDLWGWGSGNVDQMRRDYGYTAVPGSGAGSVGREAYTPPGGTPFDPNAPGNIQVPGAGQSLGGYGATNPFLLNRPGGAGGQQPGQQDALAALANNPAVQAAQQAVARANGNPANMAIAHANLQRAIAQARSGQGATPPGGAPPAPTPQAPAPPPQAPPQAPPTPTGGPAQPPGGGMAQQPQLPSIGGMGGLGSPGGGMGGMRPPQMGFPGQFGQGQGGGMFGGGQQGGMFGGGFGGPMPFSPGQGGFGGSPMGMGGGGPMDMLGGQGGGNMSGVGQLMNFIQQLRAQQGMRRRPQYQPRRSNNSLYFSRFG